MQKQMFICVLSLLLNNIFSSSFENNDSHYEKCKEFEKVMGKPNIYYDEHKDLVMLIKITTGKTNRVIDSGINSVGIQLKKDTDISVDEELIRFLSQVLQVKESFFTVLPGGKSFEKSVKIRGSAITAYDLIDKLVAALEVTAREEPLALGVTNPPEGSSNEKSQEGDQTKEFDWTNKQF